MVDSLGMRLHIRGVGHSRACGGRHVERHALDDPVWGNRKGGMRMVLVEELAGWDEWDEVC